MYQFGLCVFRSKHLKKLQSICTTAANNKVVAKSIGFDVIKSKLDVFTSFALDAVFFFTQHQAGFFNVLTFKAIAKLEVTVNVVKSEVLKDLSHLIGDTLDSDSNFFTPRC